MQINKKACPCTGKKSIKSDSSHKKGMKVEGGLFGGRKDLG
jgi:hypothetical protein